MSQPTIVVGITRDQPDSVVDQAIFFATNFHARLLCVSVDVTRYVVAPRSDGTVHAAPYDADSSGPIDEAIDPDILERIRKQAATAQVPCDFLATAGDSTLALTKAAEESSALMIVVGTHKSTLGSSVRQFFAGSVAASLAHRQHRPVVVVPLDPVGMARPLPWDSESHT